jgi:hypothetical protein
MTWRSAKQWVEKGRHITKGEKCRLRCPDSGYSLFHKSQTSKFKKKREDLSRANGDSLGDNYPYFPRKNKRKREEQDWDYDDDLYSQGIGLLDNDGW